MSEAQASVGAGLRERHEALRDLLESNGGLLELLAELQLDLRLLDSADPVVRARILQLLEATLLQSQTLNLLSYDRHRKLYDVHDGIETRIRSILLEGHHHAEAAHRRSLGSSRGRHHYACSRRAFSLAMRSA